MISPALYHYLPQFSISIARRYARRFGVFGAEARTIEQIVTGVAQALDNPIRIKAALERCTPPQILALHALGANGGMMSGSEFVGTLIGSGLLSPKSTTRKETYQEELASILSDDHLAVQIDRLSDRLISPWSYRRSGLTYQLVISDARIAGLAPAPSIKPIAVSPSPAPDSTALRRPEEILIRLRQVLAEIDKMGGLSLKISGEISIPSYKRLLKALGSATAGPPGSRMSWPDFALGILLAMDWLRKRTDIQRCESTEVARAVDFDPHYWDFAELLLMGYLKSEFSASELPNGGGAYWSRDTRTSQLEVFRASLVTALATLPDLSEWYSIPVFLRAIQPRVLFPASFLTPYGQTPIGMTLLEPTWEGADAEWLRSQLCGPLFELGVVELGKSDPDCFRLTPCGRAAVLSRLGLADPTAPAHTAAPAVAPSNRCWLIQPNLEAVVRLGEASPAQVSLISLLAEPVSVGEHVATFRFTRSSVYYGLETGLDPDHAISVLLSSCEHPPSPAVLRTLNEWIARRERLQIHRQSVLLEFPDSLQRDVAAEGLGVSANRVGERFLLMPSTGLSATVRSAVRTSINYRHNTPQCLSCSPKGVLIETQPPDLVTRKLLELWATPDESAPGHWLFTQESVRAAALTGAPVETLVKTLMEKVVRHNVPSLLRFSLRAWAAGEPLSSAEIRYVPLLIIGNVEVAQALIEQKKLNAYLAAHPKGTILLPDPTKLGGLTKALEQLGIQLSQPEDSEPQDVKLKKPSRRRV